MSRQPSAPEPSTIGPLTCFQAYCRGRSFTPRNAEGSSAGIGPGVTLGIETSRLRFDRKDTARAVVFARTTATLIVVITAGCAIGPDFQEPVAPAVSGYTKEPLAATSASAGSGKGQGQSFKENLDIAGQWWATFRSRTLNDLVEESLKNNPSVQAAQAALRQAHENTEAQKGAYYPTVAGNYNSLTQKVSVDVSPPGSSPSVFFTLHTSQLLVSYVPDVFGLVRREVESLEAQAAAQQFQVEATYLTLTSNVVAAAIQEASLRAQIAATKKIIAIATDLLGLLRRQFELGQVAQADVLLQEAALAQEEETLPPLEKALAQQRDLLTALAGRLPSQEIAQQFTLASLRLPHELPVSLPSKLVQYRPDIKAAEANLWAASANIGVAMGNRLPIINLTADLPTSASKLSLLFTPPTNGYLLTASVTQTLFDGLSLYHKQKAAEAAYDQAEALYRSTVITAFQNVADTLRAIQADARALKAAVKAEDAAAKSLEIVRKQAALGQVNTLAILNAQSTYLIASITRILALANRYSDAAALFQALGGGWWNRTDIPPQEPFDLADVFRFTATLRK